MKSNIKSFIGIAIFIFQLYFNLLVAQNETIYYSIYPNLDSLIPYRSNQITSDYGMRNTGNSKNTKFHRGIDYVPPSNAAVIAIRGGSVNFIEPNGLKYITIEHNDGSYYAYLHIFKNGSTGTTAGFKMERIPNSDRYAILRLLDTIGYCHHANDVNKVISYNGKNYRLRRNVNQGDAIAPIGDSGSPGSFHLHLSYIEAGATGVLSTNDYHNSSTHSIDPWTSIITTPTTLNSRIRTRLPANFSDNISDHNRGTDPWGSVIPVYPNSANTNNPLGRNIIQVEVGMNGAARGGADDRYNNVVMDADVVAVLIKKDTESLWDTLKGAAYNSFIRINPLGPNTVFPNRMLSNYGGVKLGENGIVPFAYRSNLGFNPWDYFMYTDIYTRLKKSHTPTGTGITVATATLALTDLPSNVKYLDGNYALRANVSNIHNQTTQSPISNFTLDNFKPYLSRITVNANGGTLYEVERSGNEGAVATLDDGYVSNNIWDYPLRNPTWPSLQQLNIIASTSEPMQSMQAAHRFKGSNQPFSEYREMAGSSDSMTWQYPFSVFASLDTCIEVRFKGKDKNSNDILNIYHHTNKNGKQKSVLIPTRKKDITVTDDSVWTNPGSIHLAGTDQVDFCIKGCSARSDGSTCEPLLSVRDTVLYHDCTKATVKILGENFDTTLYSIVWSDTSGTELQQYEGKFTLHLTQAGNYCYKIESLSDCCEMEGCAFVNEANMQESSFQLTADIKKACDNNQNGKIDLDITGSSPYSVVWSSLPSQNILIDRTNVSNNSGLEDIMNVGAGSYQVKITDIKGCNITRTFEIESAEPIQLVTPPDTMCPQQTVVLEPQVTGGTGNYTFTWGAGVTYEDNGEYAYAYVENPGIYSITVTDDNSCSASGSFQVTQTSTALEITLESASSCAPGAGTITPTITGSTAPYTFLWSTGATSEVITGLSPDTYTLTVTDSGGCREVASSQIYQPLYAFQTNFTEKFCHEGTGKINIRASGGQGWYRYEWSNGADTKDIQGLNFGQYTVTVTDVAGCTTTAVGGVYQKFSIQVTENKGCFADKILASINTSGTYTYLWSTGSSSQHLSNPSEGYYTVSGTDNEGCTITSQPYFFRNLSVKLKNIKNPDDDCFPNGQIELISDFIHNYSWSNGQSNQGSESKISNLNSGSYMVTVSPHPGCQQILNFDLCTCVGCHDDQNTYYPTCPTTPILITTDINTPIIKSSSYLPKI